MKIPERKVLKLGISQRDLLRFVRVQENECVPTLAKTLGLLLDRYEETKEKDE